MTHAGRRESVAELMCLNAQCDAVDVDWGSLPRQPFHLGICGVHPKLQLLRDGIDVNQVQHVEFLILIQGREDWNIVRDPELVSSRTLCHQAEMNLGHSASLFWNPAACRAVLRRLQSA